MQLADMNIEAANKDTNMFKRLKGKLVIKGEQMEKILVAGRKLFKEKSDGKFRANKFNI